MKPTALIACLALALAPAACVSPQPADPNDPNAPPPPPPPSMQDVFNQALAQGLNVANIYFDIRALGRDGVTPEEIELLLADLHKVADRLPIDEEARGRIDEVIELVAESYRIGASYELYRKILDDKFAAFVRALSEYLERQEAAKNGGAGG